MAVSLKEKIAQFTGEEITWCPGCGDFAVLRAMQTAAVNAGIEPHEFVCVSGIGCSGKISQFLATYGFHGVHGRTLPVATAVKLANRDLLVVAAGGDGDGYGIGIGHLLHAIRRNIDVTYIVMDNHIYGLTTGQASPTSDPGHVTKTTPYGAAENPIRPLQTAVAAGCGFVAQGFSGDIRQLTDIMEQAYRHKGFALVNVLSPCVTFNKRNTYEFYRENLVALDTVPGYDRHDPLAALGTVMEHDALVTGVVYENKDLAPYEEVLPFFPQEPLAELREGLDRERFQKLLARHY